MKAATVFFILGMMLMFTTFMVAYRIDTLEAQLRVDLIESTGYITVTDTITITVPKDLTVKQAEWIARMCKRINKPVLVRSPLGMKFYLAERRLNDALVTKKKLDQSKNRENN